ncbi:MAG: DUF5333 domain-containing protein [Roseovarius sp.]|nr:DUF5333 domain-containing protein [Roseovarius sp.]
MVNSNGHNLLIGRICLRNHALAKGRRRGGAVGARSVQSGILTTARATAFALVFASSAALAGPSRAGLAEETYINNGLFVISVANKIRKSCEDIAARRVKALNFIFHLKDVAMEMGYTRAEIEAYIENEEEKQKMRERRNAYFTSKGANVEDRESLCKVGREEIARKSPAGKLLRVK